MAAVFLHQKLSMFFWFNSLPKLRRLLSTKNRTIFKGISRHNIPLAFGGHYHSRRGVTNLPVEITDDNGGRDSIIIMERNQTTTLVNSSSMYSILFLCLKQFVSQRLSLLIMITK